MTLIDGYVWQFLNAEQRCDLNISINPSQEPVLHDLLAAETFAHVVYLRFRKLPKNSPRHHDDVVALEERSHLIDLESLQITIDPDLTGLIRGVVKKHESHLQMHPLWINGFVGGINECQENAYIFETKIPLLTEQGEGHIFYWTWYRKEVIFL
ncbi:hypothetical protein [Acanthopleuribacter pedis]|uniref:Uncharacterized protein n=1 Tax=Acanthopleuribacter pedis TaxID=442870 RepID=A0A8J7QI43_9BACT|nr:hypothetical protein [Acanthopleuribacter pedis]MBO1318790.1 hypothetical protein [Acanthopleuribacter pedis]